MNVHTIYLIDDNAAFRQSARWLLTGRGHTVHDFGDPDDAILAMAGAGASGANGACLLVDVRMPGMSGLDVHDALIARKLPVPVIYLTGHGDVALAVEAMRKGALTFLEKPLEMALLEGALERVREQRREHRLSVTDADTVEAFNQSLNLLTPRETEVMYAIVEGHANKVIAIDLGISIKTVELHRSRVMKKLPVQSLQDLVRMVMLCQ